MNMFFYFSDEKKDGENAFKMYKSPTPVNINGIMGVASVAGYTSRNGRVSSLGGIHFFRPLDQPISFSNSEIMKKINENIASSFTKMYPESFKFDKFNKESFAKEYPSTLAVASIANVGSNQKPFIWPDLLSPMGWPISEVPQTPNNMNRNIENWLHNDIYNNFAPSGNYHRNTWMYPTFNPFF